MIAISGVSVGRFSGFAEFDSISISSARSFGMPMNGRFAAYSKNPVASNQSVEASVFVRAMTPVNIFASCVMVGAPHVSSSSVVIQADGVVIDTPYAYPRSSPGSSYILDPAADGGYLIAGSAVFSALVDGYVNFKAMFSSGLGPGYEISDLMMIVD